MGRGSHAVVKVRGNAGERRSWALKMLASVPRPRITLNGTSRLTGAPWAERIAPNFSEFMGPGPPNLYINHWSHVIHCQPYNPVLRHWNGRPMNCRLSLSQVSLFTCNCNRVLPGYQNEQCYKPLLDGFRHASHVTQHSSVEPVPSRDFWRPPANFWFEDASLHSKFIVYFVFIVINLLKTAKSSIRSRYPK